MLFDYDPLCVEIFKTVNNISPPVMKDIFCKNDNGRTVREQNIKILIVKRKRTVTFGTNNLTVLGPKLWNNLPSHLKRCENLKTFKNMIKSGMALNVYAINAQWPFLVFSFFLL